MELTHTKWKEEGDMIIATTMVILSWTGLRHGTMDTSLAHHHMTGRGRKDLGITGHMNRVGIGKDQGDDLYDIPQPKPVTHFEGVL